MAWSRSSGSRVSDPRIAPSPSQAARDRKEFQAFAKAAHAGDVEAAYNVGRSYIDGKVVPRSFADAAHWLERAASRGYVEAQVVLAELLLQGRAHAASSEAAPRGDSVLFAANEVGKPDFPAALIWARRASEAGSANGQALLAFILSSGPETLRDLDAAREWYQRSAKGGSTQGHLGYAFAIADQPGRETEMVSHIRQAASKGLPAAVHALGVVTENGIGTAADLPAAAQYYRSAAEAGIHAAEARWGVMLLDGIGVPKNTQAGETWLRRAAIAGDVDAAARVGQIYATAGDLPPNYTEAAAWFERAARAGHRGAAHALGLLHLSGSGVPVDTEEAARWFRIAAGAGNPAARDDLARLVLKGNGSAEDLASMLHWFRTAADAGEHVAEFNYAVCLAKGLGCPRNDLEANRYLRRAARDVPGARYWYGLMMAEGRGIARNLPKARRHFELAVAAGHPEATAALAELLANGRGGPRDPLRAVALFKSAARNEHAGAMFALGVMHAGGHGIEADLPAARGWFLEAARRNHGEAKQILGQFLTEGIGGDKDLEQARFWLEGGTMTDSPEGEIAEAPRPVSTHAEADETHGTAGPNLVQNPAPVIVTAETTSVAASPALRTELPSPPRTVATPILTTQAPTTPVLTTPVLATPVPMATVQRGTSAPANDTGKSPDSIVASAAPQKSPDPVPVAVPAFAPRQVNGTAPSAPRAQTVVPGPARPAATAPTNINPDWIVVGGAASSKPPVMRTEPTAPPPPPQAVPAAPPTGTVSQTLNPDWIAVSPAVEATAARPAILAAGSLRGAVVSAPAAVVMPVMNSPSLVQVTTDSVISLSAAPVKPAMEVALSDQSPATNLMLPVHPARQSWRRAGRAAVAATFFLVLGGVASRSPDLMPNLTTGLNGAWTRIAALTAPVPTNGASPPAAPPEIHIRPAPGPAAVPNMVAVSIPATPVESLDRGTYSPPRAAPGTIADVSAPANKAVEPVSNGAAAVSPAKAQTDPAPGPAAPGPATSAPAAPGYATSAPAAPGPATPGPATPGLATKRFAAADDAPPAPAAIVIELPAKTQAAHQDEPAIRTPVQVEKAPVFATVAAPEPVRPSDAPGPPVAEQTRVSSIGATAATGPIIAPASPEVVSSLFHRGEAMMRQGDVVSARLFFERAAASGSAQGAMNVGKTYDPIFLATIDAPGLRSDPPRAASWYKQAIALGDGEAVQRLKALNDR